MTSPEVRRVSRVLIVDPLDRVLLLHFRLRDGRDVWIPPGGGAEADESDEDAAVREVSEETGIVLEIAGPLVWLHAIHYFGRDVIERYFFVRLAEPPAVKLETDEAGIRPADLIEYRWWTRDEMLRASDVTLTPERIAEYLEPLLAGVLPTEPIEVAD